MRRTITDVFAKTVNPGFGRMPYQYLRARLDCGHTITAEGVKRAGECGGCGKISRTFTRCECGYTGGYRPLPEPDLDKPENQITKAGDEHDCKECASYARQLEKLRGLDRSKLSHARFREWCGAGQVHVYFRDGASPSGVTLAHTVDATDEVFEILRDMRLSPLSPTEGLRKR